MPKAKGEKQLKICLALEMESNSKTDSILKTNFLSCLAEKRKKEARKQRELKKKKRIANENTFLANIANIHDSIFVI